MTVQSKTNSEKAVEEAFKQVLKGKDLKDDLDGERKKSVITQLKTLFESKQRPGELRAYAKKSIFKDTEYEPHIQDMVARNYGLYTIKTELRRMFGPKKIFKARNILGYIKYEILDKTDNLNMIKDLRYRYAVDQSDSQYDIEREVKEKRKEIRDRVKHRKRQLEKNIDDLYVRIEILKKENRHGKFNPNIEKQISSNYELIESFESQLKIIVAEERGIMVDVEKVRAETLKVVLSKAVGHLLPHIPKDIQATVLSALKIDIQSYVNTETQLNQMTEAIVEVKQQQKRKVIQ